VSPLQRSLALLRKEGYIAEKVERPWNPYSRVRADLFGVFDILAVPSERCGHSQLLAVQVMTGGHGHAEDHLLKMRSSDVCACWKNAVARIELHVWSKRPSKGRSSRKVWGVERIEL